MLFEFAPEIANACASGAVACLSAVYKHFGLLGIAFLLCCFFGWWYFNDERKKTADALKHHEPVAFDRRIAQLRAKGFHEKYVLAMQGGLNWLAGIMEEERRTVAEQLPGKHWVAPPAWTAPSLLFTIGLSVLYTGLFVFVSWLVTGVGQIGGIPVLADSAPLWRRVVAAIAVILGIWLAASGRGDVRRGKRLLGLSKFLVGLIATFAGAGAGAFAFAFAGVGVGAFAVVGVGVGAIAVAGAGALAFAFTFAAAGAGAVAGAIAVAVAFAFAVNLLAQLYYRIWAFPVLYTILVLASILGAFHADGRLEEVSITSYGATISVFVGLLPLVNGLADWLSLGASRSLFNPLASGRLGSVRQFVYVVFDFALAVFFLALVTVVSVGIVALAQRLHAQGGAPAAIDARSIVDGIRDAPGALSNSWVYLMIATTLVPTFVHLFAALVALFGGASDRDRSALIALLQEARRDSDRVEGASRSFAWFATRPRLLAIGAIALPLVVAILIPDFGGFLHTALAGAGSALLAIAYLVLDALQV